MPQKKVTYFNIRGRGELLRLVLISQNEKFEDERLTFEEWGPKKPTMKFGQLPVLTLENGTQLNESIASAKYLARKAKIYGKDDWEMYLVDRAIDTMYDLLQKKQRIHFEKDESKKEELEKELKEKFIPLYLGNLSKYIEEAKGEFFAGAKPTLADICFITIMDTLTEEKANFPKLENNYNKTIAAFPGIKKYLETRPQTAI